MCIRDSRSRVEKVAMAGTLLLITSAGWWLFPAMDGSVELLPRMGPVIAMFVAALMLMDLIDHGPVERSRIAIACGLAWPMVIAMAIDSFGDGDRALASVILIVVATSLLLHWRSALGSSLSTRRLRAFSGLAGTALGIAILNSLDETGNASTSSTHAALETSVGQARATLPSFCKIRAIEPGGWCFYDSVLAHLPQPLPPEINKFTLATAIIERLAQRRAVLEEQLLHEDDDTVRRRETVFTGQGEDLYTRFTDQLDNFDYYVLSKFEVCCQQRPVLDSCHYADYPEISTFLNVCGLSLMRVKPPAAWNSGDVGLSLIHI